jgi:hypothetical protein
MSRHILAACAAALGLLVAFPAPAAATKHANFKVAVYVVVGQTRKLADKATFEREFARASGQLRFDKVYLEVYRDRRFATDAEIEATKANFQRHGIEVAGGITLAAGGEGGQFGTFDYEKPADREECRHAVELAARHFDRIILDDFFFYTSKSDADIAAKGARSWTQYRLETMRAVARDLVLGPARAVNPKVRMTIKYPNWYEHFQGLGYDLDQEAKAFDNIYTGTETRDPEITDQLLQPYESYSIVRYFDNIRPNDVPGGGNLGGWVDTYSIRYIDRYPEQLWDTLFAKAPEITLFNWVSVADPEAVEPGERAAWADKATSFDWKAMAADYGSRSREAPGWGAVAGWSLEKVDKVLGQLGKPIGVASYKPYQSSGEDFLQTYLGGIGLPVEMTPAFPTDAPLVLLTEQAKADPDLVAKIKAQLQAGRSVAITSGLLQALQGHGIEDIAEIGYTGRKAAIGRYFSGYGAGNGRSLNDEGRDAEPVMFPELRFYTNDSWPIIRGVARDKGFPILLMNRYSKGIFYVLDIPDNIGDLYALPQGLTNQIKAYLQRDFPVRLDAPAHVSLFAYDNRTLVVESFRADDVQARVLASGPAAKLRDLLTGEVIQADAGSAAAASPEEGPARTGFSVSLPPHSWRAFRIED